MDIALVVHRYDRSEGTGGYVVELLPRVAKQHDVTLYAAQVRAEVPAGVKVVRVPAVMRRAYTAILTFPAAFRAVRRKHDLVHAQGWVTGEAEVVTAHIVMAAWREAAREARVATPPGERFLGGLVQRHEARLLGKAARCVIAPSNKVREEIGRYYGRREGVRVIYHAWPQIGPRTDADGPRINANGGQINADVARRRLRLPVGPFMALFVGDIRKGLHSAIRAVAQVEGVRLAVVSYSSPADALGRAKEAGAGDRVHWLGPQADVSLALAAADVLVHPTIYDSFGLVVAEAMAQGLPAVVTSNAGVSELMTHRESGWIVEGDAVAGTAEALRELAGNPILRHVIGTRAREVAGGRTWDDVATETLALYEEIAAR